MKLKNYLIIIFLFVYCQANSQVNLVYALPEPDMRITYMDISKYTILDSAYLHATYRLSMVRDTLNPGIIEKDIMTLQIGKKLTKFYSENLYQNDSVCTELAKTTTYRPLNEGAVQGYEIFRYNLEKRYIVTNRIPFSNNVYVYEESLPELKWRILKEKINILGFECQKAETTFKGRNYTAWFSPEIPSFGGPWKLGDLPGLILKVSDSSDQYVFECIGLMYPKRKEPIKEYEWKRIQVSLKEWNKLESNYHKRASNYLKVNNVNIRIPRNGDWVSISDDWQMPYNPIEKE